MSIPTSPLTRAGRWRLSRAAGSPLLVAIPPVSSAGSGAGDAGDPAVAIEFDAADGDAPAPGWYLLRAEVATADAASRPRFTLVLEGADGTTRIWPLPAPAAGGVSRLVVALPGDVRRAGLVPGAGVASSTTVAGLDLEAIGRGRALRAMLADIVARGAASLPRLLATLAWRGATRGPRDAALALAAEYRASLFDAAGGSAGPPVLRIRRGGTAPPELPALWTSPQVRADGDAWRSLGDDPQLVLPASGLGRPLAAGWYRVRARSASVGGGPLVLYPDYGDGFAPGDALPLGDPGGGRVDAVVALRAPVRALRLDPTTRPGTFTFADASIARIGRLHAAWRLLSTQRRADGGADWGRIARVAWAALRRGRGAGAWLLETARAKPGEPLYVPADDPGTAPEAAAALPRIPVALRARRWGRAGAPAFAPRHQLAALPDGDDGVAWDAWGEDPQFVLEDTGVLPAGWYLFRGRIRARAGQVMAPCFYPDYGDGFSADHMILLPDPDHDGQVCTLVLFKFPVQSLRFDPSLRRCRIAVSGLSLVRLGKVGAMLRMLDGIRDDTGRRLWPETARAAGGFALALRRGTSAGAALLFERYQAHSRQGMVSYDAWVRLHDTLSASDLERMRREVEALPRRPLLSVLVPVYETPEQWLRACLDSVIAQVYPDWELCIAEDASPSERVREVLREYERRDPRIRVVYRETNGHIAAASATALEMARGEFVALLDHDDELRPHALLEIARRVVADPALRLLYSDEDKIDAHGRRFQPYFKPDWNPDLLLGQNYLCHLSAIDTALAREAGGFRAGFEGSQDHDLLLRCTERLDPAQIAHVPRVLYHWRAIEGSTALRRDAKDYAADAGARAVQDHLRRTGADAAVEQLPHGHYRVRWALPTPAPRVTLVIPTRDRLPLLRTCLDSIAAKTRYPDYRILVVDNGSVEPETLAYLARMQADGRIDVLRDDGPFNYARLNNAAVAAADGAVVALVNNDIEVIAPDWLDEMAAHALRPGIGAVGAMLYYPDDTIQHAGVVLGLGGVANHAYIRQPRGYPGHGARALVAQSLSAVTGACLVVRRDTYLAAGGLDERLQVAFNDIDFCLRLRRLGLRNLWTPFAELYHHESATRGREDSEEKLRRFHGEVRLMEERWHDELHADPAYNPNLTLDGFNFELAFPPRVP